MIDTSQYDLDDPAQRAALRAACSAIPPRFCRLAFLNVVEESKLCDCKSAQTCIFEKPVDALNIRYQGKQAMSDYITILDEGYGSRFQVRVILDSIAPCGKRLTTLECKYCRFIHSEVMTHRMFARNAASSRAISFLKRDTVGKIVPNCTIGKMMNEPFIPPFIGMEKEGMQSGDQLPKLEHDMAEEIIQNMRRYVVGKCLELESLNVHKSIINRYLEPWSYITTLITATEWNNFFRLRVHPDAEKHFQLLAKMMKAALELSKPNPLPVTWWHMPYLRGEDWDWARRESCTSNDFYNSVIGRLKKVSGARCARVSFLTQDGVRDPKKDLGLFKRLIDRTDDVIHASPLEHVGQAKDDAQYRSGPFFGWHQFRKDFVNENVPG